MARISFKKIRDDQPRESFSGLMETVKSIVFGDNLELGEGSNKYGVFSSELVVTGNREKKMNVAEVYLTTALVYVLDGAGKKASLVTFEKYAEGKYLEANTGETEVSDSDVVDLEVLGLNKAKVIAVVDMEETNSVALKRVKGDNNMQEYTLKIAKVTTRKYIPKYSASQYKDYLDQAKENYTDTNWNKVYASGLLSEATPRKQLVLEFTQD